ncbi:MAG: sigma-54 dependent transcriptional regulator [Pseudomonadota bacterium]
MGKMKSHDRVFPFVCSNDECRHEYDLKDFVEVIQLWGFIYMTKKEHMLLGLTCPHCINTTVRKYPILAYDCSIDSFARLISQLNFFVPFSKRILLEQKLIPKDVSKGSDPNDSFCLPDYFESIANYQKRVEDEYPFYIAEDDLEGLIQIENVKKLKAIPRIVSLFSAYKEWDQLFTHFDSKDKVNSTLYGSINYELFQACTWRHEELFRSELGGRKSRYFKFIKNGFDREDLNDFDYEGSVEESIFPKYIDQVIREYASFRNVLDFELCYRVRFEKKYAHLLYFREGSAFKQMERNAKYAAEFADQPPVGVDEHGMPVYSVKNLPARNPIIVSSNTTLKDAAEQAAAQIDKKKIDKAETLPQKPTPQKRTEKLSPAELDSLNRKVAGYEKEFPALKIIITANPSMMELKCFVAESCHHDINVLITGETGTGKELFAKAIHEASKKHGARHGKFKEINCQSISENLLESTLFGHAKGAFTGATSPNPGLFKSAQMGTLFLDELGKMPIHLQEKLLKTVEDKQVLPVGSTEPVTVDVKLVYAAGSDISKLVEEGMFSKDLYFRIKTHSIQIPALRERPEDIPFLADHFRGFFNSKYKKAVQTFSPEIIEVLKAYDWPGNVRELSGIINSAIMKASGDKLDLAKVISALSTSYETRSDQQQTIPKKPTLQEIMMALKKFGGNKTKAADFLGIDRSTIYRNLPKP